MPREIAQDKPYLKVKAGKQYHAYYKRIQATLILDNEQRSSTAKAVLVVDKLTSYQAVRMVILVRWNLFGHTRRDGWTFERIELFL